MLKLFKRKKLTQEEKEIKKAKNKVNFFETYTKAAVTILMVVAIIDLQLSYVLAFQDKMQIAESLSIAVVTEIIGVMAVYMAKAFLETFAEKRNDLKNTKKPSKLVEKIKEKIDNIEEEKGIDKEDESIINEDTYSVMEDDDTTEVG